MRQIYKRSKGFTLVEIIIAVLILAFLTVLVVVLLDPADFFPGARDTRRISDLQSIDSTISMYKTEVGGSLRTGGTPYGVYISLPDSNNNCSSYSALPLLTPPQKYMCADQNNFKKVDGNGWIPIDFTKIPGNILTRLPIDPTNESDSGKYYTFVTDGKKWELTSVLESDKNKGASNVGGKDGGQNDNILEIGSNLTLTPSTVKNR